MNQPAQANPPTDIAVHQDMEMREEAKAFKTDALGSLRPSSLAEAMRLADLLAYSGMVPKDYIDKPGSVLAAIMMGAEVGLAPMAALQNIAVINGRPSVWGDAMLGLCRVHREWGGIEESLVDGVATCTVTRVERIGGRLVPRTLTRTFSIDDAKVARLWEKAGPWKEYPKRMLSMRARGFALRDAFGDALRGLNSAEEMSDTVEAIDVVARDVTPQASTNGAADGALPKRGVSALKDKLQAKQAEAAPASQPPADPPAADPAALLPEGEQTTQVELFRKCFGEAETTDDVAALRRDLDVIWKRLSSSNKKILADAGQAAIARLNAK